MPNALPRASERLEPRLLLASPSTAEYYPLTPTSEWDYEVVEDDGGADTLQVKVARGTRRVNKQDASRVFYSDGDDRIQTLQSINARGKLQLHGGYFEDVELFLQPPLTLPSRLKAGTVKRARGDVDLEYKGFDGDGDYTSVIRIGREERLTVPAGTFNAVRVRIDLRFEAEEDIMFGEGPEAGGHLKHVMWLARGVGVVRAEQSYELEADFIIDEEERSGSAVQRLRSFDIAPAAAAASRARAVVQLELRDREDAPRRETPDVLL